MFAKYFNLTAMLHGKGKRKALCPVKSIAPDDSSVKNKMWLRHPSNTMKPSR